MPDRKETDESEKDQLLARPDKPLPTPEPPRGPKARGYPADPKPQPPTGQGTDPKRGDLDHTV